MPANVIKHILGNWLYMALLEQGGRTRRPPEVPVNLNQFVIL